MLLKAGLLTLRFLYEMNHFSVPFARTHAHSRLGQSVPLVPVTHSPKLRTLTQPQIGSRNVRPRELQTKECTGAILWSRNGEAVSKTNRHWQTQLALLRFNAPEQPAVHSGSTAAVIRLFIFVRLSEERPPTPPFSRD
jgi:hypothetical protein